MLPDEVGEAVERTDAALELAGPQHTVFIGNKAAWRTIRAHLLAREAEVERQEVQSNTSRNDAIKDAAVKALLKVERALGWRKLDAELERTLEQVMEVLNDLHWSDYPDETPSSGTPPPFGEQP